ncbi:MAG: phosphatidate cytidylyltransferase [Planctomycetota bacterium]|jgi:phosphatidate cytidylyltransferase
MTVLFAVIVIFGGWLDGSLTASVDDDKPVQGTVLCILVVVLIIPAQLELSRLAVAKEVKVFAPVSIIGSVLFATSWYWQQLIEISPAIYLSFLSAFSLLALLFAQYLSYGTSGVLANCGANYFSIIYLGLLSAFCVAIRIDFGLWPFLTFIFVVKCADIGAYTFGSLFGRHKFSPRISPGKTWEGMAGAVAVAIVVIFDIMVWWLAAIFGFCFAFIGQVGDLVESMIKRDAERKDAAKTVPGFGGILDIVDSPLVAAPFAYLFFMCSWR